MAALLRRLAASAPLDRETLARALAPAFGHHGYFGQMADFVQEDWRRKADAVLATLAALRGQAGR